MTMPEQGNSETDPNDAASRSDHSRGSKAGRVSRRVGVVLGAIVVVIVSVLIGVLAFMGAALAVPVAPVMFGALIVVGVLAAVGLSLLVFARTRRRRADGSWVHRTRVTQVCAIATAVVLVGLTVVTNLPLTEDGRRPVPDDTAYADLSTGSRVAWWKTSATEPSERTPVVFLHGGPGASQDGTVELLDQLSDEGFDVYYFDQPGAGHSSFLSPDEYGVDRLVADLDAFREEVVKSDTINLIGHSFGGFYAEAYTAAHPEAVEKAVLATPLGFETTYDKPTAADKAAEEAYSETENASAAAQAATPFTTIARLGLYSVLEQMSPAAAESYLPQEDQLRLVLGGQTGLNLIANIKINARAAEQAQAVLDAVHEDAIPTLILRSEKDYIGWPTLRAYRDANPHATMVFVPERDHNIFWEGSDETSPYDAVRTFLLDEPQAGEVYTGSDDPRLVLGGE